MDEQRKQSLHKLFESISAIERTFVNEWNSGNTLGISKSHIQILQLLANEGTVRPSLIAEKLQVTTGGVTVLTTKLIKSGYIERTKHAHDKRAAQITITEQGLDVLNASKRQIASFTERLFGDLTNEEIELLHKLFLKCISNT